MNERTWVYYSPEFESDKYNTEMMKYSPWSGHRTFAYDLVANYQPGKIVELGSYYGCSAFSFLQAIKDMGLNTEFYGVDTWCGDDFTAVDYREDIYGAYKQVQDSCFSGQHSNMMRMTFDDAVAMFSDASIDILHIDGSHTYEDVKHDFYTWKDKVKTTGIILFHDISNDKLFGAVMGSHMFWEELKQSFPYTVEFPFSFGLGVLFLDQGCYNAFMESVSLMHYQQLVNREDVLNKDVIRKCYFEKRDLKKYIQSLEKQVRVSQTHLGKYEKDVSEKDKYIRQMEEKISQLTTECRDTYINSQTAIKAYERDLRAVYKEVSDKNSYIEELKVAIEAYDLDQKKRSAYVEELQAGIRNYKTDQMTKQRYIVQLENTIQELNKAVAHYQKDIETVKAFAEGEKQDYQTTLCDKERYIEELEQMVESSNRLSEEKSAYISELKAAISSYEESCRKKDEYAHELVQAIDKYRVTVAGKECYIADMEKTISEFNHAAMLKERYIEELKQTIQKYISTLQGKEEYIASLQNAIEDYGALVRGKDDYISILERKNELASDNYQKMQNMMTELQLCSEELSRDYHNCRSEMSDLMETNAALLRRQKELEYQSVDMQKTIELSYDMLRLYKNEMSQTIIGRHFIRRMERKNEQS